MDYNSWMIFATIVAILPVFFIKKHIQEDNYIYLLLAMVCYMLLLISYLNLFRREEVTIAYPMLQVFQVVIVVLYGTIFLQEKVDTNKVIGLVLGGTSIYLLSK
jgi:multidrug transporter EmrE-like cation transporter